MKVQSASEKKERAPHAFVILFILILFASLLTYLVPAGQFDRLKDTVTGQTLVVADSFKELKGSPVPPWELPMKIIEAISGESTVKLRKYKWSYAISKYTLIQTKNSSYFICSNICNRYLWYIKMELGYKVYVGAFSNIRDMVRNNIWF